MNDYIVKIWDKLNSWLDTIILKLPNLLLAIIILVLAHYIAKLLRNLLIKILRKKLKNESILQIITKGLYLSLMVVAFFMALGVLDLDKTLTSVLAGAGVVALAIGLALQGTLSNMFSGVMLSFLPRIRINDYIETRDHDGFVQEISLRNVVLRRSDNHIVILPNSKFIEEPFVNFSLTPRSRVTVTCGVSYGSPLREVKKRVMELIANIFPQQQGEAVEFYWTGFGDSSINFMTRFHIDYIQKSQMYVAQDEAIMSIKELFDSMDVTIPFPIRTLEMDSNTLRDLTSMGDSSSNN